MHDLSVPKQRIAVDLLSPGGGCRGVTLFVGESAADHAGPERVSDVLCRQPFFPALDHATDRMTFVHRASVALARVAAACEAPDDPAAEAHEVEVTLADGSVVRGTLSYALPAASARILDFLNGASPFFALRAPGEVVLVNRQHVARVALVSP